MRGKASSNFQPRLTAEELVEGFAPLVSAEWRLADAGSFLRRLKAAPSVSAPYLVHHLVQGGSKEREAATALLRLLAGPRVIVPLRDVMRSRSAPDEARVAAAMVLEGLGEPVNPDSLARELKDPRGLFDSIWETVVGRARTEEAFLEGILRSIQEGPAAEREEFIRSLAEPRDPRGLFLLRPLLYAKRAGTILAAIDAVEAIGGTRALSSLKEVSASDPSDKVRRRAREAYGRLFMRTQSFFPDPDDSLLFRRTTEPLPTHRVWATLVDGEGHQAVFVARRRPDGMLKVVSILISDVEGLKGCLGVDALKDEEMAEIDKALLGEGLAPAEVTLAEARAIVAEARALAMGQSRRLPVEYEIWKGLLQDPSGGSEDPSTAALSGWADMPASDDQAMLVLLPRTGGLASAPEFRHWVLEPGLVWPYVDEWSFALGAMSSAKVERETLDQLVDLAAHDLIDHDKRTTLTRRLLRQAWLLERAGKADAARLARSAAVGLDPVRGVPLKVQPFVRGMVLNSFFNAGLRLRQSDLTGAPSHSEA